MVICKLKTQLNNVSDTLKRDWRNYSIKLLCERLSNEDWSVDNDCVQEYWNCFENKLIRIVDDIVPLVSFKNNCVKNVSLPPHIRNKLNRRKRLLKQQKNNHTIEKKLSIQTLNSEIKFYFMERKKKKVRQGIIPGNSKSLWSAVNIAKDINIVSLPNVMFLGGVEVKQNNLPETFAKYFYDKVNNICVNCQINNNVYNGTNMLAAVEEFFMSHDDVKECIMSLKSKNSEGFDRIPQRILRDGAEILSIPLAGLFALIYRQRKVPQQWLVSKITPIHKKGPKHDIENYRPIANLCSTSKIFEKLILKKVQLLQDLNGVDLTRKQQHGFKKKRNTASIGLVLQSLIARALDGDNYVLMASLDLSAAFDIVNIKLLLKRLKIVGLPGDIIDLIRVWLNDRYCYVCVDNNNSCLYQSLSGTVQGSILGPFLYAIYVAPIFDICNMSNFADDNFVIGWNKIKTLLIEDMVKKLEAITKWLRESGLRVNETKTELCLFYKVDTQQVTISINNTHIHSKSTINVLGVVFDSKLQWKQQVSLTIKKANTSLHAIRLIRKYFTTKEFSNLIDCPFLFNTLL